MASTATATKKAAPKKAAPKKGNAPAKKSAPPARKAAASPRTDEGQKARTRIRDESVIRLKGENPRREGTAAHKHFEKMKGGITVKDYLKKFPEAERRTARQWLSNTIKSGHATIVG